MSKVTALLQAIEDGNKQAADELLPVVYEENLGTGEDEALSRKAREYIAGHRSCPRNLSSLDWDQGSQLERCGPLIRYTAQAMRRILIDRERQRATTKHGGDRVRIELNSQMIDIARDERLLRLDEALNNQNRTTLEKLKS